jgi:hypothetical protein
MRRYPLLYTSVIQLVCSLAFAQLSTIPAAKAIADLPGPPKNPPIFSMMTAIWQGGLQYEDNVNLKGSVVKVVREEDQTREDNPNPFHHKSVLTFDEQEHLIERVDEDSMGIATTTLQWVHGRLERMSTEHHRKDGKMPDWSEWEKWSYDNKGRVSEFRAGRDKEQMNWLVNFRYDEMGRPLGYEDKAVSLVEISYSGNAITLSRLEKYNRHKFFEQVQRLDDQKRVTDLRVSDISGGQLKLWYHVAFRYDQKGRVIEQDTDPFKLGSGDDYSPLPGKVLVSYDDEKRTGEQKYYDPEGKLGLHMRFEFDRDGIPVRFHLLDASAKEKVGAEVFIDATHKTTNRPGDVEWEVIYDDHGNWTERRRWFIPADGSPRIMTRGVKQSITYR